MAIASVGIPFSCYVFTVENLNMDTPVSKKAGPVSVLLIITRALGCKTCQKLEDVRFFDSLQRLSIGPEGRVETSFVTPEHNDGSYPRFCCMRADGLGDGALSSFNYTYDLGVFIPNECQKSITLNNLQDFCDTFISKQEELRPANNQPSKSKPVNTLKARKSPGAMTLGQTQAASEELIRLIKLVIKIFTIDACLHTAEYLASTVVCLEFTRRAIVLISARAVIFGRISEYVDSGRVKADLKLSDTHTLPLSSAYNHASKEDAAELHTQFLRVIKKITGDPI